MAAVRTGVDMGMIKSRSSLSKFCQYRGDIYDFSLSVRLAHLQILPSTKPRFLSSAEQSRHASVRSRIGAEVDHANFEKRPSGGLRMATCDVP